MTDQIPSYLCCLNILKIIVSVFIRNLCVEFIWEKIISLFENSLYLQINEVHTQMLESYFKKRTIILLLKKIKLKYFQKRRTFWFQPRRGLLDSRFVWRERSFSAIDTARDILPNRYYLSYGLRFIGACKAVHKRSFISTKIDNIICNWHRPNKNIFTQKEFLRFSKTKYLLPERERKIKM